MRDDQARLDYWKDWLGRNEAALGDEQRKMDDREALYRGEVREITPLTPKDRKKNGDLRRATHLRNIIAENIESEVSAVIPQPKVTARRQSDEWRAKILEDMLRNELDRLPMETLNDMMERTVPIQGGAYWLVEWDNSKRTHSTVGDVTVSILHPKQVIPQDGVFGSVEDMDAIVVKLPQTRAYIKRAYGKDVEEGEAEPDARTLDGDADTAEDLVTQYVAYYRNDNGGIGKFSWANDTILEDMEDFEARRLRRCQNCGEIIPDPDEKKCPVCGAEAIREGEEESEDVFSAIQTGNGTQIPGAAASLDEAGLPVMQPTVLPYYKPDVFPLFLQKNVSVFGRLLGDSDVDKIADQQNTVNRMEQKIIDRFIKAGTRITLPDRPDIRMDPEDGEKILIGNAADAALIGVYQFSGDLSQEMQYLAGVYEEARQILGITDSFQGRKDTTAQSGVAKQFAASQSAGRLESKRIMKEAAYAELFKRIAMLKVAYADEPRPVVAEDNRGQAKYEEFNRYDFYEQDEKGQWHCILDDDRFLYSCDVSAPLANNRPQMWQEVTAMYQMGAFGDPSQPDASMLLWQELERLHYPNASDIREALELRMQQQQEMQMQQMQMQQKQAQAQQQMQEQQMAMQAEQQAQQAALEQARFQAEQQDKRQARQDADRQAERDADARAREDAWRTVQSMMGQQRPM
ncbi:MAG: hypothetical protein J6Y48_20965 [Clostridia bacterium]|nr:hypothetical protein [Clostridia bacterium]